MKSLNFIQLIGLVGGEPTIYAMPSGTLLARFSVATDEIIKTNDLKSVDKHTEWHAVVMYDSLAETAQRFLLKGTAVYVSGKVRKREYEDSKKGTQRITEIIGQNLIVLQGGKQLPQVASAKEAREYLQKIIPPAKEGQPCD